MRRSKKKSRLHRHIGEKPYRKLFVIATEGIKTEAQYFALFNNQKTPIEILFLQRTHRSNPLQVLGQMEEYIAEEGLIGPVEAWLVVDMDDNQEANLAKLAAWANKKENHCLALSNPQFEYWLLLHFEDSPGNVSSRKCISRLKQHLPRYDKGINQGDFSGNSIRDAIRRAKQQDSPPCTEWPRTTGTTVYRLVENILRELRSS